MPVETYTPPQGYIPGGNVIIDPPDTPPYGLDNNPTANSNNAVKSGGVFEALTTKEPVLVVAANPSEVVLDGNKTWRSLSAWVQTIVEAMDLGTGGGGGGGGGTPTPDYVSHTELGKSINTPTNLQPQAATLWQAATITIPRSTFKLSDNTNATVELLSAPNTATVTINSSNVVINWIPNRTGANYVTFLVSNAAMISKVVSLRINVTANTVVTEGDNVVVAESVSAGMLVNIYDDNGTPKLRPARANDINRIAHAFVATAATAGQTIVPKFSGINPYMSGLTAGQRLFLSWTTPGATETFGPAAGSGMVWQPIGVAVSATEYELDIDNAVLRS